MRKVALGVELRGIDFNLERFRVGAEIPELSPTASTFISTFLIRCPTGALAA